MLGFSVKDRALYRDRFKAPGFTSNMTKEEAFITILVAAAYADGQLRRVEEQELNALLGRTRTLHDSTLEERKQLLQEATEAIRDPHRKKHAIENACAKLRELEDNGGAQDGISASAFAHACDIVHADLEFHKDEVPFISSLRRQLKLDRALADRIEADIMLKNLY
jgi:uncharacterized membrane protein YebE (DUF533 family)